MFFKSQFLMPIYVLCVAVCSQPYIHFFISKIGSSLYAGGKKYETRMLCRAFDLQCNQTDPLLK